MWHNAVLYRTPELTYLGFPWVRERAVLTQCCPVQHARGSQCPPALSMRTPCAPWPPWQQGHTQAAATLGLATDMCFLLRCVSVTPSRHFPTSEPHCPALPLGWHMLWS